MVASGVIFLGVLFLTTTQAKPQEIILLEPTLEQLRDSQRDSPASYLHPSTDADNEGPPALDDMRILQEEIAKIEKYPWMVAILHHQGGKLLEHDVARSKNGRKLRKSTHTVQIYALCSGFLVSDDKVVTACHCLLDHTSNGKPFGPEIRFKYPPNVRVRAGNDALQSKDKHTVQLIKSLWLHVHPSCVEKGLKVKAYDVGMIETEAEFSLNVRVSPYPLSNFYGATEEEWEQQVAPSLKCTSLSWGETEDDQLQYHLRKARMKMFETEECQKVLNSLWKNASYEDKNEIDQMNQICAASSPAASCRGGYGGPLYCGEQRNRKPVLYGIMSFNENCLKKSTPAIFTKTNDAVKWWIYSVSHIGSKVKEPLRSGASFVESRRDIHGTRESTTLRLRNSAAVWCGPMMSIWTSLLVSTAHHFLPLESPMCQ